MLKVYNLDFETEIQFLGSLDLPNQVSFSFHTLSSPFHVAATLYQTPTQHGLSGVPTIIFVSL